MTEDSALPPYRPNLIGKVLRVSKTAGISEVSEFMSLFVHYIT